MEEFKFAPEVGFRDKTSFPDPATEEILRDMFQRIPDQLRDYINNTILPEFANLPNRFSNPNLLINSDFRNPVNQRGKTSYIPESNGSLYSVDRWALHNKATMVVNDGSVTIESPASASYTGRFFQKIEKGLPEDYYTITVKVIECTKNVSIENFGSIPAGFTGLYTYTTESKIALTQIIAYLPIGTIMTLEYIKLEQGKVATSFVPRLYVEELALCQRYYHIEQSTIVGYIGSSSKLYCRSDNMLSMRIVPTISNKPKVSLYINGQIYEYTPSSIVANGDTGEIVVELGTTSISKNTVSGYFAEKLILDAEIY